MPSAILSPGLSALALGFTLELAVGEPKHWHPLVAFGTLASWLEVRLNLGRSRFTRGLAAVCLLLVPALLAFALARHYAGWVADGIALWFALGAKSLYQHIEAIRAPLMAGRLDEARAAVGRIVSRDTSALDETGVCRATLESLLENGSDAVAATLFWFALAGGYGVILHRLVNTLDAMWGYRTARFERFGKAAARLDDLLNCLPARLTALAYALCGDTRRAVAAWRHQASGWESPNAGPVMASGAGALGVRLGGAACYHGQREIRPALGMGRPPVTGDIARGLALTARAGVLLAALLTALEVARWIS
ncbi:adenosylcobinamide-phosphate synthase CbiB [Paludibacterium paludis]|uniref:Cobalamin biosynthesis protein CobD n=1 Tax=Paludibacterium paludis TaxID=1225769 RepID=A0A918NXM9_9NEIS|nr:adenosylcobinamide-phosphate synthase CbiB [Paludibacterium paludis]GGY05355.1 cobalamin biosynthesis protein CobD [Paludibacterium paludis]